MKKEIIQKINQLYITYRGKFLVMKPNGEYITVNKGKLTDYHIKRHLEGIETIGVFSGGTLSSFLCFDVDVPKQETAKWVVYKLTNTLISIGIPERYIYISFSGSKGYHVEIFFNQPVMVKDLQRFYLMVLNTAELLNIGYGQVEFRPTAGQGVKLPLGKHMKTKNLCWYCNWTDKLKPIKEYNYVLGIQQMDTQFFYDLMNEQVEYTLTNEQAGEFEEIKSKYKPLDIYKQNIDEEATIEAIEKLIRQGLTMKGTRHNSLIKIAKYYRYKGLSQQETEQQLIDWLGRQNKRTYTTKWEKCLEDIREIVDWVYKNNVSLTIRKNIIDVTAEEIGEIMKIKGKNEKLLLFVMIIHSKRYALGNGVFYMTYKQMQELTGIKSNKTVVTLINKLEELGIITVVERNVFSGDDSIKKPNKYKINLLYVKTYKEEKEIIKTFAVCDKNCVGCFYVCICNTYSEEELKKILPRRQFENVREYNNYCSNIG